MANYLEDIRPRSGLFEGPARFVLGGPTAAFVFFSAKNKVAAACTDLASRNAYSQIIFANLTDQGIPFNERLALTLEAVDRNCITTKALQMLEGSLSGFITVLALADTARDFSNNQEEIPDWRVVLDGARTACAIAAPQLIHATVDAFNSVQQQPTVVNMLAVGAFSLASLAGVEQAGEFALRVGNSLVDWMRERSERKRQAKKERRDMAVFVVSKALADGTPINELTEEEDPGVQKYAKILFDAGQTGLIPDDLSRDKVAHLLREDVATRSLGPEDELHLPDEADIANLADRIVKVDLEGKKRESRNERHRKARTAAVKARIDGLKAEIIEAATAEVAEGDDGVEAVKAIAYKVMVARGRR